MLRPLIIIPPLLLVFETLILVGLLTVRASLTSCAAVRLEVKSSEIRSRVHVFSLRVRVRTREQKTVLVAALHKKVQLGSISLPTLGFSRLSPCSLRARYTTLLHPRHTVLLWICLPSLDHFGHLLHQLEPQSGCLSEDHRLQVQKSLLCPQLSLK